MAKAMTKAALIRSMAEKLALTNKQTSAFFDLLSETAVEETSKRGEFTIPGIGRLVKPERSAHQFHFIAQMEPRKKIRAILRAREAALDAGGGLISLEYLDAQVKGQTARVKRSPTSRRVPAAVKRHRD